MMMRRLLMLVFLVMAWLQICMAMLEEGRESGGEERQPWQLLKLRPEHIRALACEVSLATIPQERKGGRYCPHEEYLVEFEMEDHPEPNIMRIQMGMKALQEGSDYDLEKDCIKEEDFTNGMRELFLSLASKYPEHEIYGKYFKPQVVQKAYEDMLQTMMKHGSSVFLIPKSNKKLKKDSQGKVEKQHIQTTGIALKVRVPLDIKSEDAVFHYFPLQEDKAYNEKLRLYLKYKVLSHSKFNKKEKKA